MSSYIRWKDIRAEHVARADGEDAVQAGKQELLNEMLGHRLAEVHRDGHTKRSTSTTATSPPVP